jgi:hypothetical protein
MPSDHSSKRAILYARVSTDEQARSGYSLAQQLEALREYAPREGYEVLQRSAGPWTKWGKPGAPWCGPRERPSCSGAVYRVNYL